MRSSELPILEQDSRLRQATMGSRVFAVLQQAIVQLKLRPGHALSEAEIARQLQVSRQPVREAFIKLAEVGLVEIRPQRGTFVRLISIREVQNARFLREAIEVAIVRKAAGVASRRDVSTLKGIVMDQRSEAGRGDNASFLRLDDIFHQTVAATADCDDAWRVLEGLKAQMDRVRYLSLPNATPLSVIIDQHDSIVEALAARSPDRAEAAMHHHLSEIMNSLPQVAASNSELFAD